VEILIGTPPLFGSYILRRFLPSYTSYPRLGKRLIGLALLPYQLTQEVF